MDKILIRNGWVDPDKVGEEMLVKTLDAKFGINNNGEKIRRDAIAFIPSTK